MPGIPEKFSSSLPNFDSNQGPTPSSAQLLAILENPITPMPAHFEPVGPIHPIHAPTAESNVLLKKSLRTISSLAGIALGVMASLAIAGVMVTPVGWGIAGGILAFALIGSLLCGGPEEFKESLKLAVLGTIGGGFAVLGPALHLALWAIIVSGASGVGVIGMSLLRARLG